MVTERTALIVNTLSSYVASGLVWNTDFEDAKYRLGGAFEKEVDNLRNLLLESGDGSGYTRTSNREFPGISDLYDIAPHGLYGIRSFEKKFRSKSGVGRLPGNIAAAVEDLFRDWLPIYDLLYVQAKPLIKKGRKPSDDPTKTDPRTLEHTGTCAVCGGNVKLSDSEKIVRHGYTVEGGEFCNDCPGVGFPAWEVSTKGAEVYLKAVIALRERRLELLGRYQRNEIEEVYSERFRRHLKRGETNFDATYLAKEEDLKREVSHLGYQINRFETKIANWEPATLPGILAGFDR